METVKTILLISVSVVSIYQFLRIRYLNKQLDTFVHLVNLQKASQKVIDSFTIEE